MKTALTTTLSAAVAAMLLFVGSTVLTQFSPTTSAQAPTASPQITRNTMLDMTVDLQPGTYHMVVAELDLDPRAETPTHIHPGPSVGFVENGRLSITLAETGEVATYSSGSAFEHPWDRPHVMANNSDQPAKMLSFELNPAQ